MKEAETIMESAETRMDQAIRRFKRAAFGDEEYVQETLEVMRLETKARSEPPPPPETRKPLIRNWAWNKRWRGH